MAITCKKGDTIIEVMFATAVFALVAVLGLTLMNSGVSTAQASLEITLAREAVDSQAEALRMIHNAYAAQAGKKVVDSGTAARWSTIDGLIQPGGTDIGSLNDEAGGCSIPDTTKKRFVVDVRDDLNIISTADGIKPASTFPRLVYGNDSNNIDKSENGNAGNTSGVWAEGIWIQAVKSVKDTAGNYLAIDFHIRTCWDSPGRSAPSTIGTIVRLYNVGTDFGSGIIGGGPTEPTTPVDVNKDFSYTGSVQTYHVAKTGKYKLEVWGAQFVADSKYATVSGGGGYSTGTVALSVGQALGVYVGGSSGFNGGTGTTPGAGATDMRLDGSTLYHRIIVAGGAGRCQVVAGSGTCSDGGAGGGLSGLNGKIIGMNCSTCGDIVNPTGGTQVSAGSSGTFSGLNGSGTFGSGGGEAYFANGGGGGWYGGSAGCNTPQNGVMCFAAAAGGSGWIYTAGSFAVWQAGNSVDAAKYQLSSAYYLTNATTASGNTAFPAPGGGNETGHSGNGFARITWLGV
ncbi:MAG: hypothetical protein LBG75_02040 [Candidatus Nomurabacteria bacterium]|nr:hypothetical protein [Candidatus Nomurabacteria bacterium]